MTHPAARIASLQEVTWNLGDAASRSRPPHVARAEPPQIYTVEEVADLLEVSQRTSAT
jgi:hypothetical protein